MDLTPDSPTSPRLRGPDPWALLILFVAALALLAGPVFDGNTLYFRDLQIFFVPLKQFLADSLRAGVLPFWNPNVSMGTPYFAEMQTGVLYPPSWLLLLWDGADGIAWLLVFHLMLAAGGAYLFARSLGLGGAAAFVSAATYAFGGSLISSLNMINFMQGLAWLPVVLWAFERDARLPGARRWVVAALAVALQTLAGAPDVCIMTGLIVAGRQLMLHGYRHWGWLWRVGAAYLLALLVTAPQLIATYELYTQSVRTAGLSAAEIQSYSMQFAQLWSLVAPPALRADDWDIFAVFPDGYVPLFLSLYVGWLAMLLVACALWRVPRRTVFWLVLAGLGVFLALGGNNPAAMWVYESIAIFRYPEKYVVLLHVALSVLAGLGAQALFDVLRARGWCPTGLPMGIGALLLAELLLVNRHINLQQSPDYFELDALPDVRALTAWNRAAPGYLYARDGDRIETRSVRELYGRYRQQLAPHIGTLAGLRYVQGTEGLTLRDHALVSELLDTLPPTDTLARRLQFFNAPYVMTSQALFSRARSWLPLAQRESELLWRLPQTKPMAYFPAAVLNRPAQAIRQAVDDPAFITGRAAFTDTPDGRDQAGLRGRVLDSRRVSPNRMEMDVSVDGRGFLVWQESFYPGWRVRVDGVEAELSRANHLFMGVWLGPGSHRVVFEFVPSGFYPGLGISLASLLLLALVFWQRLSPALLIDGVSRWRRPQSKP